MFYWFLQHNTDFWVAYRRGREKLYEEEFGPVRTATQAGTFFGAGERAADKNHFVALFETQPSKTYGGQIKVAISVKDPTLNGQVPAEVPVMVVDQEGRTVQTITVSRTPGQEQTGSAPGTSVGW